MYFVVEEVGKPSVTAAKRSLVFFKHSCAMKWTKKDFFVYCTYIYYDRVTFTVKLTKISGGKIYDIVDSADFPVCQSRLLVGVEVAASGEFP